MRVLIITYYWPPSGGAGVQRWLKFVKYFRSFGCEPIVYTPENPEIPVLDNSLEKDVPAGITILKQPVWEPYSVYKKFIGQKKDEKINAAFLTEKKKPGLAQRISVWVRGNFFIPDARKYWIKPSVHYLLKYLNDNPVDVIISTGPPHSMHLIAMQIKNKLGIPWLADFRDPWTNIDFYKDLMLTSLADKKHHRLEKKVLQTADAVVSVTQSMTNEFKLISGDNSNKFSTITNGFDDEDAFKGIITLDPKFSIAHIGTLVKTRNPLVLWKALSELVKENKTFAADLEIKLVGKFDLSVLESLQQHQLESYLHKIDYLPHNEVIKFQQQAQLLLLIINDTPNAKGILTGKFFEYLAAARPILCIGPTEGEAAVILNNAKAGTVVNYSDVVQMKTVLMDYYHQYKKGALSVNSSGIEQYSRKNLTKQLVEVLKTIVKK